MIYKNTLDYRKGNQEYLDDFNKKYKYIGKGETFTSTIDKDSEQLPKFHLYPTSGLLNDPNGLHKDGDWYYIYYQLSPIAPYHLNKHWGLYKTKNFIEYFDEGVVIAPDEHFDKQGVFSGASINDGGDVQIFYTGNLKEPGANDLDRDATTIHYNKNNDKKTYLFSVDKDIYHGHFRDPFPFAKDGKKFMLNGAMLIGETGTISIHSSDYWNKNWDHLGNIKINNLNECWMIECPSLLTINEKDLLMFSVMKSKQFLEQFPLDPVVYSVGNLNLVNLEFNNENIRLVDYGYDFYAPQLFNDGERNIMIGWLGNTFHGEYMDANVGYNGLLTIPREIEINGNKLYQRPIKEFEGLIGDEIDTQNISDTFNLFTKINSNEFSIKIENEKSEYFTMNYSGNEFNLNFENSSKGEKEFITKTGSTIPANLNIKNIKIENIRLIFDTSVAEVFINDGEYTMTQRIYLDGKKTIESDIDLKLNKINHIKIN